MAGETRPQDAAGGQQQQGPQFPLDTTNLSEVYTNFCHVSVTPEELVLDFGLNPRFTPTPTEPVKLTHRVVMNFFTAKRLMIALMNVVNQHENTYGPLELDIQKRVRSMPRPPAAPPGAGGGGGGAGR